MHDATVPQTVHTVSLPPTIRVWEVQAIAVGLYKRLAASGAPKPKLIRRLRIDPRNQYCQIRVGEAHRVSQRLKTIQKQHSTQKTMLATLYISILLPIQVHPMTYPSWKQSSAPIVQATIDAARIIGLPRMWTLDKPTYIYEIHAGPIYRVHPRRAFIREYVK
jgi:hypothetical protein